MKETADGEHWASENRSITEASIPVREKSGIVHEHVNRQTDIGIIRLIFSQALSPNLHVCAQERNSGEYGQKRKQEQFIFKDLFTVGDKKSNKYRYLGHGRTHSYSTFLSNER